MSENPVVYLVDDDVSFLKALTRLLGHIGYEVEAYDSPVVFLENYDPTRPGCALLDVGMADVSGLELQQRLVASNLPRPIIFITGGGDVPTSVAAMKAGAVDFLTKPVDEDLLLGAIERALVKDAQTRRQDHELEDVRARLNCLTPREREVLLHVVGGRLNKQIAGDLGTVEKTIKVHRARVMEKMGVRSVAELVRTTERLGIAPFRAAR